ncbi:MAG TPA: response regulator [Elusimicrobiota bacterium]|nr:response regulator [Elusimicrobiota bacterium]
MSKARPVSILIAEDDDDDFELARMAFEKARVDSPLSRVKDGEELMDFLLRRGAYKDPAQLPFPMLILLDLRMPKKDGWEALAEIKSNPGLRRIPVAILTTSNEDGDIARCYDLGCNSYIKKPVGIGELAKVVQAVKDFWLGVVEFPPSAEVVQ